MKDLFTADFFTGNRNRLRDRASEVDLIVITANGQLQKSQDTTYEFTQDSNFWYLTGVDNPDVILVMDQQQEYLIVPELSDSKIFFDGAIITDELKQISGITKVLGKKEGMQLLERHVKQSSQIGVLASPPDYIEQLGMYTNPARSRLLNDLKRINKTSKTVDMRDHLASLRMIKQPVELTALQRAIDITCQGVGQAMQNYLQGTFKTERDTELFLQAAFYESGGAGHAFEPIIASGSNACTIHPVVSAKPLQADPLLVDVGAAYDTYKADISRSWSVQPTERYKTVLQAVKEVSDYAMSLLQPGVSIRDYEKLIEKAMGKQLKQLGLISTASRKNIRAYFPHATSHFLGIDVHDVGLYDEPLQAGSILTVEPGIYIKEEGIGVRIENDVLITDTGCKNLSASLADLQPNL